MGGKPVEVFFFLATVGFGALGVAVGPDVLTLTAGAFFATGVFPLDGYLVVFAVVAWKSSKFCCFFLFIQ